MTLTIALAIVGGLVLAGVVAHGAWTARKAGPRRADAQLEPRLNEPSLNGTNDAEQTASFDASLGRDELSGLESRLAMKPHVRKNSPRIDALIDAIASLTLDAPLSAEVALAHYPPTRRAGTKPFLIEGLNSMSGEWELPMAGQHYGEFQAGVQLANRSGALNQIEYSEFVQKVQEFADGLGAFAQFPDMLDVVARARELDGFASAHDAQLAVVLRSRGAAWSVGYVQQMASRHGLVAGAVPGRLVMSSEEEGAPPVLVLSFDAQAALAEDPQQSSVRELSLSLDVPQTPESSEPFAAWQQAARAIALDIDADITDDRAQAVNLHAFASIGMELNTLYQALASHDLAAGSMAARRLFS